MFLQFNMLFFKIQHVLFKSICVLQSRQHRSRYGSSPSSASSSRSQGTPGSHKESWTHKGVRMPPRDRIVNGVRIRAGGGTESGDRAAAESIALRVHSVAGSHGESPHSARSGPVGQPSSHTPRSSRSSVRSRASAPAATRSENIRTNENTRSRSRSKPRKEEHADNVEKTHDAKSVTSLLRAVSSLSVSASHLSFSLSLLISHCLTGATSQVSHTTTGFGQFVGWEMEREKEG